jgi:hypothetical protein
MLARQLAESSVAVWFLQRGLDVIAERDRHLGGGGHDPAEPGHRAMASSTPAISSSLAPAASARPVLHSRHTVDDPMAADAATRSSAAVLGSSADGPAGSSPSPAWPSAKPSSIIASLRRIFWNLTV